MRYSSSYNRRGGFHPNSVSPAGGGGGGKGAMQNAYTIKNSKIKTMLVPKKEPTAYTSEAPPKNRLINYLSFKR